MFNRKVMFSSKSEEWETPQDVFDYCNEHEGPFTLDVCATPENAKCERYFTREDDGLSKSWYNETCWMNPPFTIDAFKSDGTKYRKRVIHLWIKKAYEESRFYNTKVVCLLPSRTDTSWFHDYCTKGKIWFIRGRLKFGGATTPAPYPSMIVIFE